MMGHNIKPEWVSLSLVLALATGMILADAFTLPLILWLFIFWLALLGIFFSGPEAVSS